MNPTYRPRTMTESVQSTNYETHLWFWMCTGRLGCAGAFVVRRAAVAAAVTVRAVRTARAATGRAAVIFVVIFLFDCASPGSWCRSTTTDNERTIATAKKQILTLRGFGFNHFDAFLQLVRPRWSVDVLALSLALVGPVSEFEAFLASHALRWIRRLLSVWKTYGLKRNFWQEHWEMCTNFFATYDFAPVPRVIVDTFQVTAFINVDVQRQYLIPQNS